MRSIALVIALLTVSLPAQEPAFKAGVDLVSVPIAVMDGDRRRHVDGLTASDFRVFEDGVAQQVAVLDRERRAVSLCIAVDASTSMGEGNKQLLAARSIRETVGQLDPDDEFAVVTFAQTTEVVIPWTAVRDAPAVSFDLAAEGSTALIDGLKRAVAVLDTSRSPKRAILLVTDGFENSSKTSLREAVSTRRQSETLVYAFGLTSPVEALRGSRPPGFLDRYGSDRAAPAPAIPPDPRELDVLSTLVGDSGGVVFRIGGAPDASTAARALIDDLRFQYTLGYTPSKAFDGRYRRIKVETSRRGVTLRHRSGYLATP